MNPPPQTYVSPYSFTMIVPAYNEEELLEFFVRKSVRDLSKGCKDFEILLVDDGSTDRTGVIADQLAEEFPQVRVLHLGRNYGVGYNFIESYGLATKDYIFWNTVDGFFDTADLHVLARHLETHDIVSGYRTNLKANNFYQKLLTLGNFYLVRILYSLNLKAFQTVQLHPRSYMHSIKIEGRSSFIAPELLYKAQALGLKIKEVPITFHPRQAGVAKGGKPRFVMHSVRDVLKHFVLWRILKRPLVKTEARAEQAA